VIAKATHFDNGGRNNHGQAGRAADAAVRARSAARATASLAQMAAHTSKQQLPAATGPLSGRAPDPADTAQVLTAIRQFTTAAIAAPDQVLEAAAKSGAFPLVALLESPDERFV
jgi:hypothetical protein